MKHDPETRSGASNLASWLGLALAPALSAIVYASLSGASDLSTAGRATASIGTLMAVLWMTEALPLPATSLLPILLFPLAGVFPSGDGQPSAIRQAAAPYAHELIFLFMGGFMMALAVERWNLHRRLALATVLAVGTRPTRLIGGIMLVTAFLSMWISNTATTVMMLPIGLSVTKLLSSQVGDRSETSDASEDASAFAVCTMLGIAYAASIGGVGTLIGTPPNVVLAAYLKDAFGIEIGFGRWMAAALPLVVVFLVITWFLLTRIVFPVKFREIPGGRELIRRELDRLGPLSRGEWMVGSVVLSTAVLWIVREPLTQWSWFIRNVPAWNYVHDASIALAGALILFVLPVDSRKRVFALDWDTAKKLPWGVLILFGGGLSLASAVSSSGLAEWIGAQLPDTVSLPVLLVVITATVIFLTELTSNTATASIFLPLLGGAAVVMELDPRLLAIPAGVAASCAFMLPVATPPNAIVFGSGHLTVRQMARAGLWLNLLGVVLIPSFVYVVMSWVLGVRV